MKTTTAFLSLFTASMLAFGCAGDQKDPNEPDTSKETGEAVESRVTPEAVWRDGQPYHAEHGVLLGILNEKMSKSRGNVVNPDDVIAEFGADSLRLYEMFMGPHQADKPWQTAGIQGVYRFLDRVHGLAARVDASAEPATASPFPRCASTSGTCARSTAVGKSVARNAGREARRRTSSQTASAPTRKTAK